jgi:hypothetical protein
MDGPNGQRINDTGRFVVVWKKVGDVVWKKVGDDWKAALDIFSSDRSAM